MRVRVAHAFVVAVTAFQLCWLPTFSESDIQTPACVDYPLGCKAPLPQPQPCDGYFPPHSSCMYMKGLPDVLPQPNDDWFPSSAVDLTVNKYSLDPYSEHPCQFTALNVSWKLNVRSGSVRSLKGFILHVENKSTSAPIAINILRYFNLTSHNVDIKALEQVEIYYPCIVTDYMYGAQYHIQLQSVPIANYFYNTVEAFISIPPLNRTGSCYWMAEVVAALSPCTVTVEFSVGPLHCNFSQYLVQLVYSIRDSSNNVADRTMINASAKLEVDMLQTVFMNVTDETYSVWIQPVASYINSNCICRDAVNMPSGCDCPITTVGPFEVTCDSTSSPSPPLASPVTSAPPVPIGSVVGICIGIVLAVAALLVIMYFLYQNDAFAGVKQQSNPEPNSQLRLVVEKSDPEQNSPILMVYVGDYSEEHQTLIDRFSSFIKAHITCEIKEVDICEQLDCNFNWEIADEELSNLLGRGADWHLFKHVVVVYYNTSAKYSTQAHYSAFLKAIEFLQRYEEVFRTTKLVFVSFKLNEKEHFLGVRLGRKFQLLYDRTLYLSEFVEAIGGRNGCSGDCDTAAQLENAIARDGIVGPRSVSSAQSVSSLDTCELEWMLRLCSERSEFDPS